MLYHTLYNKIHIFFVVVVSSRHTLTFSKKKKYIYIYIKHTLLLLLYIQNFK